MSDGEWMLCTCCRQAVWINATGICLACQRKYTYHDQPDSWANQGKNRAVQEPSSETSSVCDKQGSSGGVRKEGFPESETSREGLPAESACLAKADWQRRQEEELEKQYISDEAKLAIVGRFGMCGLREIIADCREITAQLKAKEC